jgi:hypothetical protein
MTLKKGSFTCIGKVGKKCKGVLDRELACKGQTSIEWVAGMPLGGMRKQRQWKKAGTS